MDVRRIDHANLRTGRLEEMIAWYRDVLGFEPGWRPDFPFPGAWLYRYGQPLVHLVGLDAPQDAGPDLTLEHVAFSARGFSDFTEMLDSRGEEYRLARLEDAGIVQVNIWDPDGNHLHIDFETSDVDS